MSRPIEKNQILSKKVVECLGSHWHARETSSKWYKKVEYDEKDAQIGETFLVRRDHSDWDVPLEDGSERVLREGAQRWHPHPWKEGTFRVVRVITEYGTERVDHPAMWCRYIVSYREEEESPRPFQHDRYNETERQEMMAHIERMLDEQEAQEQ